MTMVALSLDKLYTTREKIQKVLETKILFSRKCTCLQVGAAGARTTEPKMSRDPIRVSTGKDLAGRRNFRFDFFSLVYTFGKHNIAK